MTIYKIEDLTHLIMKVTKEPANNAKVLTLALNLTNYFGRTPLSNEIRQGNRKSEESHNLKTNYFNAPAN